jgi:hypothetical protein
LSTLCLLCAHCAHYAYYAHCAPLSTLCTLCTLNHPETLKWAYLRNHLSVCDEPKNRFNTHPGLTNCASFTEHPTHSLQYDSISTIDQGGHVWCTTDLKISARFQHTRMHLVQCAWEGDWAKFEPARMILADSMAVARQVQTPIFSNRAPGNQLV